MRGLAYVGIIIAMFGTFAGVEHLIRATHPPTLTKKAVEPDFFLQNAKVYLGEANPGRGLSQLEQAIEAIDHLRAEANPESIELIDPALTDLKEAYQTMSKTGEGYIDVIYASVEVLLALTHVQVIEAEQFIELGKFGDARTSLKHGMTHVKTASIMSEGTKKDHEIMIYSEMNEIVENHSLDRSDIEEKLSKIKKAIVKLEVSFFD